MQFGRQLVAWLVLGMLLAIPAVALHASSMLAAPPSGGCHEHGGSVPAQPAGFACCERGHRAALPVRVNLQQVPEAAADSASIERLQKFPEYCVIALPRFAYSPPEFALRV